MSLHFVIKCVLNHRIRGKLCVQYKMNPFWAFVVVNYCNLWYPVISVRKWNACYFFLIFCYQMKSPGTWKIYLPLFFFVHMLFLSYKPVKVWIIDMDDPVYQLFGNPTGDILNITFNCCFCESVYCNESENSQEFFGVVLMN